MKQVKLFGKSVDLDTNLFEIVVTGICSILGGVIGFNQYVEYLPISKFNFIAISVLLGFVTGFILSALLVWIWKKIQK